MVAMFGWIIPDPLHIPPTRTSAPPRSSCADASLGTVSVVMMARAAAGPPSTSTRAQASAMPLLTASIGR